MRSQRNDSESTYFAQLKKNCPIVPPFYFTHRPLPAKCVKNIHPTIPRGYRVVVVDTDAARSYDVYAVL